MKSNVTIFTSLSLYIHLTALPICGAQTLNQNQPKIKQTTTLKNTVKPLTKLAKSHSFSAEAAKSSKSLKMGTKDGGGTSGINDMPIEYYSVPVEKLKGFEVYKNILRELQEKSLGLPWKLQQVTKKSTFYVVPAELYSVSSEVTGAPFKTTEFAINSHREVFINEDWYNSRTEDVIAITLTHEALMSRLLERFNLRSDLTSTVRKLNVLIMHRKKYGAEEFVLRAKDIMNYFIYSRFGQQIYTAQEMDSFFLLEHKCEDSACKLDE